MPLKFAEPNAKLFSRCFSSPASLSWDKMTSQQRQAWDLLGWSKHSWEGVSDPPLSDSCLWRELDTAQQAAAQHGLGYSQQSWDSEIQEEGDGHLEEDGLALEEQSASSVSGVKAAEESKRGGLGAVVGSLFRAVSTGASIVDLGFQVAHDPEGAVTDTLSGPPVVVQGIESIVYLDDSTSMLGGNIKSAHAAYQAIAPALKDTPTRVVMFGTGKSEVVPRGSGDHPPGLVASTGSVTSQWYASSGGTYLWHMVYKDITARYRPGAGTLRVYVITDGEDVLSPLPYTGMEGMNPLMKNLLAANYRIEWSIIVVGMPMHDPAARTYQSLCAATGGSFLALPPGKQGPINGTRAGKDFVAQVKAAHSGDKQAASRVVRANRAAYEKQVQEGKTRQFEWYAALPPPPKAK